MIAAGPDLLRLLVLPVFVYVAIIDVRTRRVPRLVWPPVILVGAIALVWDGLTTWSAGGLEWQLWALSVAFSLAIVAPLGYLFWYFGAFGLADAKALIAIAVVFPIYPVIEVAGRTLPLVESAVGVFSLTVLVNAVLIGLIYPLILALRNLRRGNIRPAMFVGVAVPWSSLDRRHGRLLENRDGVTRSGLDLDALRMYLRWRDVTLAALRDDPARLRDPASLPPAPADPGDGRVLADGGMASESDDPWGARAFIEATGGPYGTRADQLRDALELLCERERVWISPGIPFLVLIAVGLGIGLTYGSILTTLGAPVGF